MRALGIALLVVAGAAVAGGRHRGGSAGPQYRFGPYTWSNHFDGRASWAGQRPRVIPYAYVNPYAYALPYWGWYTAPYTLNELPAVNQPPPEPPQPAERETPTVVVFQAPAPAPAPEPAPAPQVVVVQPAPAPAPVAAPAPAAVAEAPKPQTPGPDVYLWTDADGTVHYSTLVPDDAKGRAKKLAKLSR